MVTGQRNDILGGSFGAAIFWSSHAGFPRSVTDSSSFGEHLRFLARGGAVAVAVDAKVTFLFFAEITSKSLVFIERR